MRRTALVHEDLQRRESPHESPSTAAMSKMDAGQE
jgi:hypothetical protein